MDVLDSLGIDHIGLEKRELILSKGDVAHLYQDAAVDYLIVSSLPNNYEPGQGGWIEQLVGHGIEVSALERECSVDFRPALPCWISAPSTVEQDWPFKRLVVFEPENAAQDAGSSLWKVFQAVQAFAGTDVPIRLAAPLLSTQPGQADPAVILRMMFFAAASAAARAPWVHMQILVSAAQQVQAQAEFAQLKASYIDPPTGALGNPWLDSIKLKCAKKARRRQDAKDPAAFGLTTRQFELLFSYTQNLYWYVNRALRADSITDPMFVQYQASIEAIGTALSQLPNATQWAVLRYMDIFEGIEDIYQVGTTVREMSYFSSTRNAESPTRGDYMIQLGHHQLGKDISRISHVPTEEEVLFDSNMHHLISATDDIEEAGRWVRYVTTDEVLPNTVNRLFSHL